MAAYLATMGRKVLLVDIDPQGNATTGLGFSKSTLKKSVYQVLIEGEDCKENLLPTELPTLTILPANIDLAGAEVELVAKKSREKILKGALDKVRGEFDYIFIDCPPSLGRKLISVLLATEYVVCPVKLSGYAVDGLEGLFQTLFDIKKAYNPDLKILGAIINEYDRSSSHNEALEMVRETIPSLIFKNIVCHRSPIDAASLKGEPIWRVRNGWRAAAEIKAVVNELKRKLK